MIDARELRIGNFVWKHGKISLANSFEENSKYSVHPISDIDICAINQMKIEDWYIPIPLTEKWLLKFGFDPIIGIGFDFNKGYLSYGGNRAWYYYIEDSGIGETVVADNIKYVHKLQNLYYELTGEELTIKETA